MNPVDFYKGKLGVTEDKELAALIGRTPGAVSNWRKQGIPAIAERKLLELLINKGIDVGSIGITVQEQISQYEAENLDPLMQLYVNDLLKLSPAELAQAYANFKRDWEQGEKKGKGKDRN